MVVVTGGLINLPPPDLPPLAPNAGRVSTIAKQLALNHGTRQAKLPDSFLRRSLVFCPGIKKLEPYSHYKVHPMSVGRMPCENDT